MQREKRGFISSSNFSLGVNIFFELNEHLAKMMSKLDNYTVEWKRFIIHKNSMHLVERLSLANGIMKIAIY
jgi:4-hydroxy-tetrahydrodipicolinate reductase